jgi:hypothetical protein
LIDVLFGFLLMYGLLSMGERKGGEVFRPHPPSPSPRVEGAVLYSRVNSISISSLVGYSTSW